MPLTQLHRAHQDGLTIHQASGLQTTDDAETALYLVVWAHAEDERDLARHHTRRARTLDPNSEFARLFHLHLEGEHTPVYDSPRPLAPSSEQAATSSCTAPPPRPCSRSTRTNTHTPCSTSAPATGSPSYPP